MRLRHIEVFHAVYSSGSVTRAAEILNVSQPSISKVLAHAEQQLGYPLFDRTRGKLIPTPEADELFGHVSTINNNMDRLRLVAENLRSADHGQIRVAATPAFGIDVLPGAIASYREQHSEVFFTVETRHHDGICKALIESRIDVGLVFDPVSVPGIESERLGAGSFYVLAPPGSELGERKTLTVKDLEGYPYISLDRHGPLGRLLSRHIESSGVALKPMAFVETYQVAKSLVAYGSGVMIADQVTAFSSDHDNVVIRPLVPNLSFNMSALHHENEPMSLICRDFVEHLKSHVEAFISKTPDLDV